MRSGLDGASNSLASNAREPKANCRLAWYGMSQVASCVCYNTANEIQDALSKLLNNGQHGSCVSGAGCTKFRLIVIPDLIATPAGNGASEWNEVE